MRPPRPHAADRAAAAAARSSKVPGVKIGITDPRGAGLVRYFTEGSLRAEVAFCGRCVKPPRAKATDDARKPQQGSSISEGIGQNRITGNLQGFKPGALPAAERARSNVLDLRADLAFEIPDEEMIDALHNLQRHEGLFLGGSSGINVAGAIRTFAHARLDAAARS